MPTGRNPLPAPPHVPRTQASDDAFFDNASAQNPTKTIKEADSPEAGPPIQNGNGANLTGVQLVWDFELYVVALTKDTRNGANTVYVGEALATWKFNGNGTVAAGAWTSNGAGITVPTDWIDGGYDPLTDDPRFNDELRNATWPAL